MLSVKGAPTAAGYTGRGVVSFVVPFAATSLPSINSLPGITLLLTIGSLPLPTTRAFTG
jgi:hypothetical protein